MSCRTASSFVCRHRDLYRGLSMQVGGTGLTVTGANRVILVDPAWNPSADAQAIDRVHRIGQKREVPARGRFDGWFLLYNCCRWLSTGSSAPGRSRTRCSDSRSLKEAYPRPSWNMSSKFDSSRISSPQLSFIQLQMDCTQSRLPSECS